MVAAIQGYLTDQQFVINEFSQVDDIQNSRFFVALNFLPESCLTTVELSDLHSKIRLRFEMNWRFIDRAVSHRRSILVSKFDHCLNDMLFRKQAGQLNIDVTTVASNFQDLEPLAKFHQAPYVVLPRGKSKLATMAAQEKRIRELIDEHQVDLVALPRYIQALVHTIKRSSEKSKRSVRRRAM